MTLSLNVTLSKKHCQLPEAMSVTCSSRQATLWFLGVASEGRETPPHHPSRVRCAHMCSSRFSFQMNPVKKYFKRQRNLEVLLASKYPDISIDLYLYFVSMHV